MKQFYEKNVDFKEYVDKYACKNNVTIGEALTHSMVKEVYQHYKKEAGITRISIDDK